MQVLSVDPFITKVVMGLSVSPKAIPTEISWDEKQEQARVARERKRYVCKYKLFSCLDHTFPVHLFYQLYMQEAGNLNITSLVQ